LQPKTCSRRLPLRTVAHVHAELARVYRAAKDGALAPDGTIVAGAATRLAMILDSIRRCIVDCDFEQRLAALEDQQDKATT